MALGGVAIGIMKAKLAASVAGKINRYGCMPIPMAIPASIGTKVAVVAVFDVSSVKNMTLAHTININKYSGIGGSNKDCAAINSASTI